jgi:hypothetical protein
MTNLLSSWQSIVILICFGVANTNAYLLVQILLKEGYNREKVKPYRNTLIAVLVVFVLVAFFSDVNEKPIEMNEIFICFVSALTVALIVVVCSYVILGEWSGKRMTRQVKISSITCYSTKLWKEFKYSIVVSNSNDDKGILLIKEFQNVIIKIVDDDKITANLSWTEYKYGLLSLSKIPYHSVQAQINIPKDNITLSVVSENDSLSAVAIVSSVDLIPNDGESNDNTANVERKQVTVKYSELKVDK